MTLVMTTRRGAWLGAGRLARRLWAIAGLVLLAQASAAQVPPPPEGAPLTPALRRLLEDDGAVERVATNFRFADGPVWVDGALVFTDAPRSQVVRWRPGEPPAVVFEDSGGARGLTLDAEMRLIAAEAGRKRVTRREDGQAAVLVAQVQGQALVGPTDVALAPDGTVYVVDAPSARRRLAGRVIRVRPDREPEIAIDGLARASGIAVAADGGLYVADSGRRELRAYAVARDGVIGAARKLASILPWKRGVTGRADGITLDRTGRLYLAGPGGIWVIDRNGGRLGVIATPETPSACAFGDADGRTLYITAETSLYKVRMTEGVLK
jgi:gluconolactonase